MHSYMILAVAGAIDLAESMRQDIAIAKKILDFFWLKVHKHVICSKVNGNSMFGFHAGDTADAAAFLVCCYSALYTVMPDKSMHLTRVSNPFYKKSLEEIKIMLDLLGNDM